MIKKSSLMYILSFFIGVMFVNLIGSDYFISHGVIPFWNELVYTFPSLSYDRYFCYILLERIKGMFVLVLLTMVLREKPVFEITACFFCFLLGTFFTMSIMDRGIYGVLVVLAALLPQWGFYAAAFCLYTKAGTRERGVLFKMFLLLLVLFGCLLESYLSPFFLKKIIF